MLGTFIAGAYSCTYAASDLGLSEDGYQLGVTYAKELIQQTDRFGDSVIDAVYRGVSGVTLNCVSLEYKQAVLNAMFPYQGITMAPTGVSYFDIGTVGVLDTELAGAVVLTALAGTSAAGASTPPAAGSPTSLTASKAILRENHELQWALTSRIRKVPLSFRLYPTLASTTYRYFTTT